jgi:hypothetical protein
MPVQLPNLDDRSFADLVEEARRLIPTYAPEWTNHNPSDPGITLIEMFAYLTEMMLYRLNRVTEANQVKFLKLLNAPDWKPSGDLDADTRATVRELRARFRAVTATDYERLAIEDFNQWLGAMQRAEEAGEPFGDWWTVTRLDSQVAKNRPLQMKPVKRARCVPARNLDRGTEQERTAAAPGHVSLVIVPGAQDPLHVPIEWATALWGFLDERRMLTTRHHVVGPSFAPVSVSVIVAQTEDAVEEKLRLRVVQKLEDFLHPLTGGPAQQGWPFGRDVYVSELVEQLEAIPGVDYVTDVMLDSWDEQGEPRCVPATQRWHAEGELIGLELAQHHLPKASIQPSRIVIAPHSKFVPVRVSVTVTGAAGTAASLKAKIKSVVRGFFHPVNGGGQPGANDVLQYKQAVLTQRVLEAVGGQVSLEWETDAAPLVLQNGTVEGFFIAKNEVINWRTAIVLS